jgi:hypothetical protein
VPSRRPRVDRADADLRERRLRADEDHRNPDKMGRDVAPVAVVFGVGREPIDE